MFEFAYPFMLLLLLTVPFIYIFAARHKGDGLLIVPNAAKIKKAALKKHYDPMPAIFSLTAVLLIIALARPRTGNEIINSSSEGIDISLAIDLSGSMDAIDIPEGLRSRQELQAALNDGRAVRRIDGAKKALAEFVEARKNDRIGLIGFGELAYTLSPPTGDHNFLLQQLQTLQTGQLGDRTGLASPVAAAVRQLRSNDDDDDTTRKVAVLFTDGVNTVEDIITPEAAAELAAEKNIVIYTVGIGGSQALADTGFGLTVVNMEFDEELLKTLAETGNGKYFHAKDTEALERVLEEINQLEKTDFINPAYIKYNEYSPVIAAAALLLLFIGILLKNTILLRLP